MIHAFHIGHVDEVLAGAADKDKIYNFVRTAHLSEKDNAGCSWAALGIMETGAVWVMAGATKAELIEALEDAGAIEAELLELTTLN